MEETIKTYTILIVDDEQKICEILSSFLSLKYKVKTVSFVHEAMEILSKSTFDLLITDLKLPDGSGIDILDYAKKLDSHIEAIIITGYASLDTATKAINLGASSYLIKPITIPKLSIQVEKALANRSFYTKSQLLIHNCANVNTQDLQHIFDITHIHDLFRKLIFSLNINDIMKTLLTDLHKTIESAFCIAAMNIYGSLDIYALSLIQGITKESIKGIIQKQWNDLFKILEPDKINSEATVIKIFNTEKAENVDICTFSPISIPLICMGETKGILAVFIQDRFKFSEEKNQYFHVFSSLVSPLIENPYIHKQTKNLAATDHLTGVANHRTFHEMLSREIARSNREKTNFGLIILDIDDFKQINDTYGHLIGDAVLKDLCKRIMLTIREQDLLARYGGEEFVVIVTKSQIRGTYSLADRIRIAIAQQPAEINGLSITYTVSVGISMYSGKLPRKKFSLIRDADDALYSSKDLGKNRVSLR